MTANALAIVKALVDTARRTTELEHVYNDESGEAFTWFDVMAFVDELQDFCNPVAIPTSYGEYLLLSDVDKLKVLSRGAGE